MHCPHYRHTDQHHLRISQHRPPSDRPNLQHPLEYPRHPEHRCPISARRLAGCPPLLGPCCRSSGRRCQARCRRLIRRGLCHSRSRSRRGPHHGRNGSRRGPYHGRNGSRRGLCQCPSPVLQWCQLPSRYADKAGVRDGLTDVLALVHQEGSASETCDTSQCSIAAGVALLLRLFVGVSAAIAALTALLVAATAVGLLREFVSALACLAVGEDVAVLVGVPFGYPRVGNLGWSLLTIALVAILLTSRLLIAIRALLFVLAFFAVVAGEFLDEIVEERHLG